MMFVYILVAKKGMGDANDKKFIMVEEDHMLISLKLPALIAAESKHAKLEDWITAVRESSSVHVHCRFQLRNRQSTALYNGFYLIMFDF